MTLEVCSPLAGTLVASETVADPVFGQALLGAGTAVDPTGQPHGSPSGRVTAAAPVAGTITKLHPHAFVVTTQGGYEVLVHLGLDTVGRTSPRFAAHVTAGQAVRAGDPVITWSPAVVEGLGLSPVVPVVALGSTDTDLLPACPAGAHVGGGDLLFTWR